MSVDAYDGQIRRAQAKPALARRRMRQRDRIAYSDVEVFSRLPRENHARRRCVQAALDDPRTPYPAVKVHELDERAKSLVSARHQPAQPQQRLYVRGSSLVENRLHDGRLARVHCVERDLDAVRRRARRLHADAVYRVYERIEHPHHRDHHGDDSAYGQRGQKRSTRRSRHVSERYLPQGAARYAHPRQRPRQAALAVRQMPRSYGVYGIDAHAAPYGYRRRDERRREADDSGDGEHARLERRPPRREGQELRQDRAERGGDSNAHQHAEDHPQQRDLGAE